MGKKRGDPPKVAKTVKVTRGRLKGHVHEYTKNPGPNGTTTYRCIAGGGCTHAYSE